MAVLYWPAPFSTLSMAWFGPVGDLQAKEQDFVVIFGDPWGYLGISPGLAQDYTTSKLI